MGRRDGWTEERRAAERAQARERMRRLAADPDYRAATYARRAAREAANPDLKASARRASSAYYGRNRDDASFAAARADYLARWREERRADEQFDAFMARLAADDTRANPVHPVSAEPETT